VAVYQISLKPGDPSTLVAATYGRGVYTYKFSGGGGKTGGGCVDRVRPRTRFSPAALASARSGRGSRKLRLSGTVTDRGCKGRLNRIKRTIISVARQNGSGVHRKQTCRNLQTNGRLGKSGSCHKFIYLTARRKGTRWSFTSKRPLAPGQYRIRVKSIDAAGNHERPGKKTNTVRLFLH
jgi:hypothetical protein